MLEKYGLGRISEAGVAQGVHCLVLPFSAIHDDIGSRSPDMIFLLTICQTPVPAFASLGSMIKGFWCHKSDSVGIVWERNSSKNLHFTF